MIATTSNRFIETSPLDLASLASIRRFPSAFLSRNLPPGPGLPREYHPSLRFGLTLILPRFRWILNLVGTTIKNVQTSGQAMARLMLASQLETLSENYFQGIQAIHSSKESYDQRKAAGLGAFSVEMVRLQPNETILQITQ